MEKILGEILGEIKATNKALNNVEIKLDRLITAVKGVMPK